MSDTAPDRVALVPGALALLPEYASVEDPVAELRAASVAAVRWLAAGGRPVEIVADAQGERVARALVRAAGGSVTSLRQGSGQATGSTGVGVTSTGSARRSTGSTDVGYSRNKAYLVVGNGSAKRSQRAPGHLDERAAGFDAALGAALRAPDPGALGALDRGLAWELWASVEPITRLGRLLSDAHRSEVDYDAAPHGVQYWVVRWSRGE